VSSFKSRPKVRVRSADADPIKRKCPDQTLVRRKLLPGRDYRRTHSHHLGRPDLEQLTGPESPFSTLDLGPGTLDSGAFESRPHTVQNLASRWPMGSNSTPDMDGVCRPAGD
jgi:hypothetical protein